MAWRRYLSTLSACPLRRCRLLALPGGRLAPPRSIRPPLPPHTIHTPTDPRMALLAAIPPIHHAIRETLKNSAALILDRGKSVPWPSIQLRFRLFSVCP